MSRNWWPFPPPVEGTYNIRKVGTSHLHLSGAKILRGVNGSLWHRSNPVTKMRDWEFQFTGSEVWVPYANLYDLDADSKPVLRERKEVPDLPRACCKNEALFIVRALPYRWPQYQSIHIEYEDQSPGDRLEDSTSDAAPPDPTQLPALQ